ncbi:hypothetical protein GOP47_0026954, partial [Adiantum capillus-veneris]
GNLRTMEEQQQHWQNAQSLELGLDLVAAARSQLRLLAAVDSHPLDLYRGPALHCAILRYENCWLRLLADHGPYASTGLPLIPPLDCAWIWHCHRLNPVQYIRDCKASYGKLLDAPNVSTGIESEAVAYTQQLWDSQFSDEKYEAASEDLLRKESAFSRKITYDLQAAIERQSSFFYQVSRPHMEEERFLYAALQRYKGFLYLLKLSRLRVFLVPTYDIDLMWHSHQACSGVYREDTVKLLGRVLNHDDTDSDRTEGQKLDTGFNRTRNLWQNMFGSSYEKAGAMYRGEPPALPLLLQSTQYPAYSPKSCSTISSWKGVQGVELRKSMQVFITVQKARNLHASQDGVVGVRLLFKNKCSTLKLETSWIKGTQNPQWKDFWSLECEEATEGLRLELLSEGVTCCSLIKKSRLIGWTEISWKSILSSSTLSLDGWVPLIMKSNLGLDQKPTSLRVSVSITPPTAVPFLLRMEYPLLRNGKRDYLSKTVYDHQNKKAFMVKINGLGAKETSVIQVYRIGCKESPEILLGSAARIGPASTAWSLLDGDMHLIINSTVQGCQLNIIPTTPSENSVTLLHGRKCQYEVPGSRQADEAGFITFVRQLQGIRNGKATALFNWKSGAMEISSEENGVLVVLLCTILSVAADTIHVASFWNSTLGKLKKVSRSDDWGSVILNKHWDLQPQRSPQFCPWYSMSSNQWLSSFYGTDLGCNRNWVHSLCKLSSGCGTCGGGCGGCGAGGCGNGLKGGVNGGRGGGCGGCGAGGCMNGMQRGGILLSGEHCANRQKHSSMEARGGGCGGCGAGGCGGCGAGGCANGILGADTKGVQGGKCGRCGAGGCGNKVMGDRVGFQASQCGGCGAGGCGNTPMGDKKGVQGGQCGGCGAGGCGNSIAGIDGKGVQGSKCGGCGAGDCGKNIRGSESDGKGVQGGKCGACGAGGCGNGTDKATAPVQGSGCGGCGAGGCGNSIQN